MRQPVTPSCSRSRDPDGPVGQPAGPFFAACRGLHTASCPRSLHGCGVSMALSLQTALSPAVLNVSIPWRGPTTPVQAGSMLLIAGLVALFLLAIAGERFYARYPAAAQMWRARALFVLAAGLALIALVIEGVRQP